MSISEVAAASGLRPSALRYYEDEGLIAPEARIGGRRHYRRSVLRRLAIIALFQEVGFTVGEIGRLLRRPTGGMRAWQLLAETKLAEIDAHIENAQATRKLLREVLACGCEDPAGCLMVSGAAERRLLRLGATSRRGAPAGNASATPGAGVPAGE